MTRPAPTLLDTFLAKRAHALRVLAKAEITVQPVHQRAAFQADIKKLRLVLGGKIPGNLGSGTHGSTDRRVNGQS